MSKISSETSSGFFPNSKSVKNKAPFGIGQMMPPRNDLERQQEIRDITSKDAKVNIPDKIKDFSRIKKVVENVPDIDNSEKIINLKDKINAGKYEIDYDALAEKMLTQDY